MKPTVPTKTPRRRRLSPYGINTRTDSKWFLSAREKFPQLGILGYLPPEIRTLIFEFTLGTPDPRGVDGPWEYCHLRGSPFNLSAYNFGLGARKARIDRGVAGLSVASSAIRAEYQECFLTRTPFRFNQPANLYHFICCLTDGQLRQLKTIVVGVNIISCANSSSWLAVGKQLPRTLRRMQLKVYRYNDSWQNTTEPQGLMDLRTFLEVIGERSPNAQVTVESADPSYQLSPGCREIAEELLELSSNDPVTARLPDYAPPLPPSYDELFPSPLVQLVGYPRAINLF